jgi:predicted GNAT family acetyltransferase
MFVTRYDEVGSFLERVQKFLEYDEVVNGLLLGLCFRMQRFPPTRTPYLAVVSDGDWIASAAVMVSPHKLIIYGEDSEALLTLIDDLRQDQISVPGVLGPDLAAEQFARLWSEQTGRYAALKMCQRVYELRDVNPPTYPAGYFRAATPFDEDTIARWMQLFHQEEGSEISHHDAHEIAALRIHNEQIYLWETVEPVSMAAKALPTRNGTRINSVYTPPQMRRRGYGTACVAQLSQMILESGSQFCMLFTDLANPVTNGIYQNIGYRAVCDFKEYGF